MTPENELRLHELILLREEGHTYDAAKGFDLLARKAAAGADYEATVEARIQQAICHQVNAVLEDRLDPLHLALELLKPAEQTARKRRSLYWKLPSVFYRQGVIEFHLDRYKVAGNLVERAMATLPEENQAWPEYAAYYGTAKFLSGQSPIAPEYVFYALTVFQAHKKARIYPTDWNADIVEAGIHMHLARIAHAKGDKKALRIHLKDAKTIATRLHKRGKILRTAQYNQLVKKLKQ